MGKKLFVVLAGVAVLMIIGAGKKPPEYLDKGITAEGITLYLAAGATTYTRYDTITFAVAVYNNRAETLKTEPVFSDFVEPKSAINFVALDNNGARFSGFAGSRTEPGEDYEHFGVSIEPKQLLQYTLYHRDCRNPLEEGDRPLSDISDREGTYAIHAVIYPELFGTQSPIASNTIQLTVSRK